MDRVCNTHRPEDRYIQSYGRRMKERDNYKNFSADWRIILKWNVKEKMGVQGLDFSHTTNQCKAVQHSYELSM
jgi:hypothetical protein